MLSLSIQSIISQAKYQEYSKVVILKRFNRSTPLQPRITLQPKIKILKTNILNELKHQLASRIAMSLKRGLHLMLAVKLCMWLSLQRIRWSWSH